MSFFATLALALCAAVTVHNVEEGLFLPEWSRGVGRFQTPVGAFEFRFAVAALTLAAYVCAALATAGSAFGAYLVCGYALAMAANAFVPHLVATLALRRYAPGTATGLLLNLPIGVALIAAAAAEGRIAWPTFVWAGPMTMVALVATIPVLFALGRALAKRLDARQSC
jgi:hypothetical protein